MTVITTSGEATVHATLLLSTEDLQAKATLCAVCVCLFFFFFFFFSLINVLLKAPLISLGAFGANNRKYV